MQTLTRLIHRLGSGPRPVLLAGALLLALQLLGPGAWAQTFSHPGLLHTQADFTRMQTKVAAGAEPWTSGYNRLASNSLSSLTRNFTNPVPSTVYRGFNGTNPENYPSMFRDIAAAYATALRWKVTGDVAYANKSIAILNAWSQNLTAIDGTSDKYLAAGIYGYEFANVGEIMRDYSGWAPADFLRFQNMMRNLFYPMNHDFLVNHNGTCSTAYWANWDLCNTASMLAIGVLCDDRAIYNEALDYYKHGNGSGAFNQLIPYYYGNLAQWQEAGRDQGHTALGVALAGSLAQMAYNQGDDLFAYGNNALLKAFEYIAKYNLGYEVPYTTYRNCAGIIQTVISTDQRGNVRPVWELVYNHYVNLKGLSAPHIALQAQRLRPEGGGGNYDPNSGGYDQLGYGTLAYSLDEPARPSTQTITFPALPAQAYGAPDFSPGATASSGLPVTYSVLNPTIASVTSTGQLRVLRPGTTTVYAQQLGDATYNPAPVASQTLTVNQVPGTTDGTWSNTAGTITSAISSTSGSPNLTWAGQTFVVGEHLKLNAPVPGGFTAGTIYTVVAISNGGSTFQLALQPGGTAITATSTISNGVGQRVQKWSVATNWSGGTLPGGPNATATFGATSFANVPSVSLDGNITIGNLVYAANGTSELVLASGLNNGQLTFAVPSGTPTLTMINSGTRKLFMGQAVNNARVPLRFAGTQGLNITTPLLGGTSYAGLRIQAAMDWSNFSGTLSLLAGTIELHNTTGSTTAANNVLLPAQRLSLGVDGQAVLVYTGNGNQASTQTVGALDGTPDAFIFAKNFLTGSNATLVVGADNQDGSYAGTLGTSPLNIVQDQGLLHLEKVGTGTQFISGVIKNGITGSSASAVRVRDGKLVLQGANEYQGGTTVFGGTLEVNGSVVSPVVAQAGTVAGSGTYATTLTVGTGAGTGATLAPGSGGIGTLTATGAVSLLADATFAAEFSAAAGTMDQLVANGLTLTNTSLTLTNVAGNGTLPLGSSFVLVNNTGAAAVAGIFQGQPEGSTLTVGSTILRLSYLGGTGNDVTLTAVASANTVVWTGNSSTDWNTAANWLPATLPTAATDVVVPGTAGRQPTLSSAQTVRGLALGTGALLTTTSTGTLTLLGDLTNNGGALAGQGTVALGGSSAQTLGGTAPLAFENLTVGAASATLSGPVTVQRLLTLNGNLATNGNLTLLSNAAGTAMVVNSGSAEVAGNVTVQRYIDPAANAGAGYRHYSSPVRATTVADLTTSGFTPVVNPAYNSGSTTNFPTVFGYDETRLTPGAAAFDRGWFSPSALTDALTPGRGYTVNVPATQTVDFVGVLGNGPVSLSNLTRGTQPESGWHLLGNPYPAPLNWDAVSRTGVDGAVYVYHSTGQYAGTYSSYVAGSGGVGTNGGTNQLAAMQGFFVRTSTAGTPGAVSFANQARLTSYASPVFNRTTSANPLVRLQLQPAAGAADEAVVYFAPGATTGFDSQFDAYKLPVGGTALLASELSAAQSLSINGLPVLTGADVVVNLRVATSQSGSYTLRAAELLNLPTGTVVYLRDAQTGTLTDLQLTPNYACTLTAGAPATGRFSLLLTQQRVTATAVAQLGQQVSVYPNPAHDQVTIGLPTALNGQAVRVRVLNALGQTVRQEQWTARTGTERVLLLDGLAKGVYTLQLLTPAGTISKRLVCE
jgi:autotransporter-associated beta strand protein